MHNVNQKGHFEVNLKAKSFSQKEMTMPVIPKSAAADEESLRLPKKRLN